MQTIELIALDGRLKREVEVAQRLHRGEPGAAHGGLQAALIAKRDVTAEERFHRRAGGELARIDAPQDVIGEGASDPPRYASRM